MVSMVMDAMDKRTYQPTGTLLDPERFLQGKLGPLIKSALALAVDPGRTLKCILGNNQNLFLLQRVT